MSVLRKIVDKATRNVETSYEQEPQEKGFNLFSTGELSPPGLLPVCGNMNCRTGWIRLWRRRATPRFEGAWACSEQCLEVMLRAALDRESVLRAASDNVVENYRHRVPLGLLLYSQGAITEEQLKEALEAQREARDAGRPVRRIGRWLIQNKYLEESQLATALSVQWNCPVYSAERFDQKQATYFLPRLFVESYNLLPLRRAGSGQLLVAYEERFDHRVNLALERMHRTQVVAGVMAPSQYRRAHGQVMNAAYPKLRLVEVASRDVMIRSMVKRIEELQPMDATLVCIHDYFWLRMWGTTHRDVESTEDFIAIEREFKPENRWND